MLNIVPVQMWYVCQVWLVPNNMVSIIRDGHCLGGRSMIFALLEACVYANCGDICSIQSVCQAFHTLLLEGRVGVIIQKGGLIHQGLWVVS